MDKLIPFLNAVSWTVIIINTVVWGISFYHFTKMSVIERHYAAYKFDWMDALTIAGFCWLVST